MENYGDAALAILYADRSASLQSNLENYSAALATTL